MLGKAVIASGALLLASGARIWKHRRGHESTKFVAGVPVLNYDHAFAQPWRASLLEQGEMGHDEESWVVQMREDISAERLEAACGAHPQCVTHGSAGGNPFLGLYCTEEELKGVLGSEQKDILFVEPVMPIEAIPEIPETMAVADEDVPWGLRRIRSRTIADMPRSDQGAADGGKGVHAYVLDTGIRTTHDDFGDRAIPTLEGKGLIWARLQVCKGKGDTSCAADRQGHGTHCAGTIGGKRFGVAKGSTLRAVKVLGDNGMGSSMVISKAVDWVAKNHEKPAVASMSLGGRKSNAENAAVNAMVNAGITVVTASGNSDADSCGFSPGSASKVINVGSVDPDDTRSFFSNYGKCMAIWAPGRSVLSAGHDSDSATKVASGTSMACPHVSGAAALLLSKDPNMSPADVQQQLIATATKNVVKDAQTGSPEGLLFLD